MMSFIWPWAFAILPLPFVLRLILPRSKNTDDAALRVPRLSDYKKNENDVLSNAKSRWPLLLYSLAWVCLVIATARPQWTGDTVELPVSGRDLMLAIDISKSMDHPIRHNLRSVSRLTATKAVASDFIEKRIGDRIGLILFGDQAYVQTPLTFDRTTVNILLQEAVTGLAGSATAIGDAIGLAVKRLHAQNKPDSNRINKNINEDRVLILLTDGVSNRGEITPLKAAELAKKMGLKIHTIGIGNRGSRELDENTLRIIAKTTGGRYFRAYNTRDLKNIYALLDELEPVEKDVKSYRPIKSLFYIPLSASFIFAAMLALFSYSPKILSGTFKTNLSNWKKTS
ncbi:Aerotolerance protein BatA [hydrothermal vent metagenome]|uniref:Aerotolerance protein BatA n=1 Tax=hydrothermal vent metagenome TaxID=652676 RepID=A0A3B0W494_9ZZZZ